MKHKSKSKFTVGQVVFVVGATACVRNGTVCRIPLGTQVTVQTISVFRTKGVTDVRYNCALPGVPVCWIDEDHLSPRVLDVVA